MARIRLAAASIGVLMLTGCVLQIPAANTTPATPALPPPPAPSEQYAGDLAACSAYVTDAGEAGWMSVAVITAATGTLDVDVTAADIEATIADVASYESRVSTETRYELLSFNEPLFTRSDRIASGNTAPVEADWEALASDLAIACGTIGL